MTPLGAVARGLVAGAAGTGAMTGWQELSAKLQASGSPSGGDEPQTDEERWEQAPAPAQVARRVLKGVLGQQVGPDRIGLLTNVMHWGYGITWGALYGLLEGSRAEQRPLRDGLGFGTAVWAASYAQLVPMGLYQPPWKYAPGELALDWSYHGAYGAGVGIAYRLVAGS